MNFVEIDVFDSAAEPAAGQNASATYERLCMSTSQLLTITESHGFRALLATVAWIVGRFAQLWRGLRNLSCGNRQPARMDVGSGSWLGILISEVASARRGPVLWFDTFVGRDASFVGRWRHRHMLLYGSPVYSPAPVLAKQARRAVGSCRR
jgi:hypothetical protein